MNGSTHDPSEMFLFWHLYISFLTMSFSSRLIYRALRDLRDTLLIHTPITLRRRQFEEIMRRGVRVPRGIHLEPFSISNIPAEWIVPNDADHSRIIYYLHGGGYVLGSIATHRSLAARIAVASKARLLIINYRLAPEYPFPAALQDALEGYRWLISQGYKNGNISIGGDSAGGGLALASLISLRDNHEPLPGAAFLISPWVDLTFSGESIRTRSDRDPILRLHSGWNNSDYTGKFSSDHPLISPLFSDLKDLPPTLIQVGSEEILYDDAFRLVRKLDQEGVRNEFEEWNGMWHVFQGFSPLIPEANKAISNIGHFLKQFT
jgi:epsilon-lactone hydrolase